MANAKKQPTARMTEKIANHFMKQLSEIREQITKHEQLKTTNLK